MEGRGEISESMSSTSVPSSISNTTAPSWSLWLRVCSVLSSNH